MSHFAQARERNDTLRNAGGIAPLLGLFVVSPGSFASVRFPFFRAFLVSLHWSFPSFLLSRRQFFLLRLLLSSPRGFLRASSCNCILNLVPSFPSKSVALHIVRLPTKVAPT